MMPSSTVSNEDINERVRQKYGLSSPSLDQQTGLSHSKSYEEIFMNVDDHLTNFATASTDIGRRAYGRERATILAILQALVRKIIDESMAAGLTVESEHVLMEPLCRMIEIGLYHGLKSVRIWSRKHGLWSLLEKAPFYSRKSSSASAIENVKQFSSLTSGTAKIRAWILLALMNKCLGNDLECLGEGEQATIGELYEEWALVRSEQYHTMTCLLGSLDSIDFNLYIKEQTISKEDFSLDWRLFMGTDRVDFSTLQPPISMPTFILQQFSATEGGPAAEEPPGTPLALDPENLVATVEKLQAENRQLRRAIISQLNQKSFFEEECTKLARRLSKQQDQFDSLIEQNHSLIAKQAELKAAIEAHEATNQSLQYQLIQAQNAPCLSSTTSRQSYASIPTSNADDRIRKLEHELKVMTALKDEYLAKLKQKQ